MLTSRDELLIEGREDSETVDMLQTTHQVPSGFIRVCVCVVCMQEYSFHVLSFVQHVKPDEHVY